MKNLKQVSLFVGVVSLLYFMGGCVSPFYGTARIEKGLHSNAGLAATSYVVPGFDESTFCTGLRADLEVRYGFSEYLQAQGSVGLGGGLSCPYFSGFTPLLSAALGVQGALPFKGVTPALRVEAAPGIGYIPVFTVTPLLGLGNNEMLTLGSKIWISWSGSPLIEVFTALHPVERWSVFGGVNLSSFSENFELGLPIVSLGVGYKLK